MELITIEEYTNIIKQNEHHLKNILDICLGFGNLLEGNCFYEHFNPSNRMKGLIPKQMNHFTLGKYHNNIMEIGFNAGHSVLLYLLSNPSSKITIFDIVEHHYVKPCYDYLNENFPNRLDFYEGDSTITVPEYHSNNPNNKFDLIHIDGSHQKDIANQDFYNCLKLAQKTIIWDDTQDKTLNELFMEYLQKNLITEIQMYKTYLYEHRIATIV